MEEHDHNYWMGLAIEAAKKAILAGEVPVGAVLVVQGELVAVGINAMIESHDPTAHAEIIALRKACRIVENYRLPGSTLYVTLEPCTMCMGALIHARVEHLVFGAYDPKTGAAGSLYSLGTDGNLNHSIEIMGGVREQECAEMLKSFFRMRRKQKAEKTKSLKEKL